MNYWHMQLHPNDIKWGREEELLEEMSLVGLGLTSEKQADDFRKKVKPLDIILIKRGSSPIALVEMVGELEDIGQNELNNLDWFRYRREVKVLDFFNKTKLDVADKPMNVFPSPRATFGIAKDKETKTYQYIMDWHKSLYPELYQINDSLKIRSVFIKSHKMFKDFKINFTIDDKILPIIVIAGINGSGKTTLLEFMKKFIDYSDAKDRSEIKYDRYNNKTKRVEKKTLYRTNLYDIRRDEKEKSVDAKYFEENVLYFPTGTDIENIRFVLSEYIENIIHKEDLQPSKVHDRVREYIDKIFNDLNLMIKFDRRERDGSLFFRNKKEEDFSIDEISTGEKTLISKVLYLYLKDIKDKVILIDEPELSLHPSWQNKILKLYENFAKENNCQIIIATHSPHIIGSAKSEWIRLLTEDGVVDNFSNTYGAKFSQILTDIMGVRDLRTPEINEKFVVIENLIIENQFDTKEFKEKWQELEDILGKNYFDLKLLKLEIASRRKDVQNNKK